MNYDIRIDKYGNKRHYVNNVLHRENGPAVEYANGCAFWYKNGELHKEDGPACIYASGEKHWYKNGKLHREDGPAVEYVNEGKRWWLNNKCYGKNNDYTVESWKKFIKTLIFS